MARVDVLQATPSSLCEAGRAPKLVVGWGLGGVGGGGKGEEDGG